MVALGLDPDNAVAHVLIRNGVNETRRQYPLAPEYKLIFDAIRRMLK